MVVPPARARLGAIGWAGRRKWSRRGLAASALAHLLALVLIVLLARRPSPPPEQAGSQVAMVFEQASASAGGGAPSGPPPGAAHADAPTGAAAPSPLSPPQDDAAAPPPSAPRVDVAPMLRQFEARMMETPPAAPTSAAAPTATPVPARSAPAPAPAPRRASPFAGMQSYSFGHATAPPPARSGGAGLALGFAIPALSRDAGPPGGKGAGDLMAEQLGGPALGRDWFDELHNWWRRHRYYPEQAARAGEDGMVRVELRVDANGHVREVEVETRSGSMWLDTGALATFRNARLPPFPPGAEGGEATIRLTLNYVLIRR